MEAEVLVVGAGPTGLMLANQLGRRGVRAQIIDRHAGPARETRALGVQARTMEIYAQLGVLDRALESGKRGTGGNIWANGRHMARVPLGEAGSRLTPYPYIFILGQDDNERILGERLLSWGLQVQWNTELVALRQEEERVIATLRQADGAARTLAAGWVAGCDGARSSVRELSGIGFPGAPYEHVFFVADTEATGSMVADEVNVYLWQDGFHLFFPMRGKDHWRVVGILPAALRHRDRLGFEDVVPSLSGEAGSGLVFRDCRWFSTYRIHHRHAEHFRDRRCFLLGDAAHIHSPVGAQGMNTGLQDAYNLAWKLALVAQGAADERLLDSYEEERLPVARRLLNTTDQAFRLVVSDRWWAGLLRTQLLARIAAFAMRRPGVQNFAFRVVSQTGIHYRESPLSQTLDRPPEGAPRAGERFPWLHLRFAAGAPAEDLFKRFDDLHFHLLAIGQPAPEGIASELLRVHVVAADAENAQELKRAGIPPLAFYLVRPDGYIGLCGTRLEAGAVGRYLAGRIALEAPAVYAHRAP